MRIHGLFNLLYQLLIPHFYTEILILDKEGDLIFFFDESAKNLILHDEEVIWLTNHAYSMDVVRGFRIFGYSGFERVIRSGKIAGKWLNKVSDIEMM